MKRRVSSLPACTSRPRPPLSWRREEPAPRRTCRATRCSCTQRRKEGETVSVPSRSTGRSSPCHRRRKRRMNKRPTRFTAISKEIDAWTISFHHRGFRPMRIAEGTQPQTTEAKPRTKILSRSSRSRRMSTNTRTRTNSPIHRLKNSQQTLIDWPSASWRTSNSRSVRDI